jgi:hypothetical protein
MTMAFEIGTTRLPTSKAMVMPNRSCSPQARGSRLISSI